MIAPDGKIAAVVKADPRSNTFALYLLDLATGAIHRSRPPVVQGSDPGSMVWSPDSRWLFVVSADGKLDAVDAHTRRLTALVSGIQLHRLSQLTLRSAPAK